MLEDAETQEREAGATIHLALNQLEPMYLPFNPSLATRHESCGGGIDITLQSGCEAVQRQLPYGSDPWHENWEASFTDDAEEVLSKLRQPSNA